MRKGSPSRKSARSCNRKSSFLQELLSTLLEFPCSCHVLNAPKLARFPFALTVYPDTPPMSLYNDGQGNLMYMYRAINVIATGPSCKVSLKQVIRPSYSVFTTVWTSHPSLCYRRQDLRTDMHVSSHCSTLRTRWIASAIIHVGRRGTRRSWSEWLRIKVTTLHTTFIHYTFLAHEIVCKMQSLDPISSTQVFSSPERS